MKRVFAVILSVALASVFFPSVASAATYSLINDPVVTVNGTSISGTAKTAANPRTQAAEYGIAIRAGNVNRGTNTTAKYDLPIKSNVWLETTGTDYTGARTALPVGEYSYWVYLRIGASTWVDLGPTDAKNFTVTGTTTPPPSSTRPYFAAADWLWKPLPASPVLDSNSATWAGYLASGQHGIGTHDYGVSIVAPNEVDSSTPRYDMSFSQVPAWGSDPFGTSTVPIPNGTLVAPMTTTYGDEGDSHLTVMDDTTNKVFSSWQTQSGPWRASWGGVAALDGDGRETVGSSTASNISRAAGVIRQDDLIAAASAGTGLGYTLFAASDITSGSFRYPASKSDGNNQGGVATPIPQGTRLFLDKSINVETLPSATAAEKVIARTLQTHGVVIGDKGGSRLGFLAEYDNGNASAYSSIGLSDYQNMTHIPWGSLKATANSNP